MKKTLFLIASAALLFVGCAKEQFSKNAAEGGNVYSFTVGVASDAVKSVLDNDGHAANVNHWIMQVLDSDGEVYNYQEKDADAGVLEQTFSVPLIKGQTYQVMFWADTKGNYVVTDLCNVERAEAVALTANRDDLDAFSAVVPDFTATVATQQTITLRRPFAQMNVVFTDLQKLYETMGSDAEYAKFKPVNFVAKAKVPTTFNVLTQEAGAPAETALEMTAAADYKDNYAAHAAKATLYMDYIFATKDDKDILDIDFSFTSKGGEIAQSFTAIPFQRNYRTNIIGEFMSAGARWKVIVNPEWDGEYDKEYVAEGSVAAAIEALKAGKTAVEITSPEDYDTPVAMPAQTDGKEISVKVSGVSGKEMTFNLAEGAQGPANLYITSDAQDLVINLPNSHVAINGGAYQNVTATTSATTLAVGKDVTIETLTINGGNVEVYGLVNTINKQASTIVDFYVSTAAGLRSVAEKISAAPQYKDFYGKVYLIGDIDLENEEWTPIAAFQKPLYIDGQGYTVKNLKVSESTADYIGFIGTACGLTVKNLNFDTVVLSYPSSVGENARGGVVAGHVWGATVENCSVKNVDITACQKVGGLLGYIEGDTNIPHTIKDCSVENLSIKSNDSGEILQHGVGGLIGHIALNQNPLIQISGCSVKDITIADFGTEYSIQLVPHIFIGNVCNNYTGEDASISAHSVVLENNTISGTNTVLPACMYSSEYFGWAGNAEERPAWKGGIYIDGQAWTPDYPVRNVTAGKGYTTLKDATDAASAGDEIDILKAGTYKVPGISKNITVAGDVDGVVFDCIGSGSIASISNGATFKNVTMNFGQSSYHGFQHAGHIVMEGCTLNGLFFSYGDMTFTGCTFNQDAKEYNMWCYGNDVTYDGCTFNSKGKFLNVYCESNATAYNIVAKDCVFNTSVANKPALNIKETSGANFLKYNVTITGCSCNDLQKTVDMTSTAAKYVGGPIWQVDDRKSGASAITVTVDGKLLYKNGAGLSIANASQLKAFADYVNSASGSVKGTFTLDADIDLTGIDWVSVGQTGHGQFGGTFDGQGHTISNLSINNADATGNQATGLFGWLAYATVKNVNVNAATVSGHHNVGVIAGYLEGATIDNCTVTGSAVSCTHVNDDADGDKCGGIVGFAGNTGTPVKDCTVSNTTISAGRDAGQVAGAAKEANITGCSADNVTVTANGTSTGANIRNEIIGRVL